MLAIQPRWRARAAGGLLASAAIAALAVPATAGRASAGPASGLTPMAFGGYTFEVPRAWPVINLADHPGTCVRFDRRAVYLGTPARNQSCPARLVGTTQSLLIERGPAGSARSAVEDPVARQITATGPRIKVTATFGTDPGQIGRILASASLPEPVIKAPSARRLGPAGRRAPARLPHRVTNYHGLGFDACTAPSTEYMRAWRNDSPYRAVGIYIGGSDRACAQPNLTRRWLRRETRAGWHFMPMYVGPQAEYGELSSPAQQGSAAATDAVTQAKLLGFRRRTPLYYDMEAYPPRQSVAALTFLSAWTATLHQLGFTSGVYSSSDSAIQDLAKQYFSDVYAIPDVIYDALWNGSPDTVDPVFGPGEWADHDRLHQYNGNVTQTFGGDAINVDQDYLDVRLHSISAAVTTQASAAVRGRRGVIDVFYRGAGRQLWRVRYRPGAGWARPVDMGGSVRAGPTAVRSAGGRLAVFYQGTDRRLWQIAHRPGGAWRRARVRGMGVLGSAPAAVSGPGGIIDVFWRGPGDSGLWHGRLRPGSGWSGPQRLGGSLASAPSPVEPAPGRIEVFWAGSDQKLWYVTGNGAAWNRPASPRAGPLAGAPQATAQPDGAVDVLWRGTRGAGLWLAAVARSGHWTAPVDLGGRVSGAPFPVAPAAGVIRVFWRGQDGRLWLAVHRPGTGWLAPVRLPMGRLGSGPFVAVGGTARHVDIFWRGSGGALLAASLLRGGSWAGPVRIGG
jgi:hypothetical protein